MKNWVGFGMSRKSYSDVGDEIFLLVRVYQWVSPKDFVSNICHPNRSPQVVILYYMGESFFELGEVGMNSRWILKMF